MQTIEKFCAVFAFKCASFPCPQNCSDYFSIMQVACFYHLPPHQTFIVICLFASVNR